jgi:hypothetical protein
MHQTPPPSPPSSADSTVETAADAAVERRLQAKLADDEPIIRWGRAWVSRDWRLPHIFAARTLDFTVITPTRLVLVSTGFFSRRPRRRVYAMTLDRLFVEECEAKRGLRLRVHAWDHRPLFLEFRFTPRNDAFADELFACTEAPPTAPEDGMDRGDADLPRGDGRSA